MRIHFYTNTGRENRLMHLAFEVGNFFKNPEQELGNIEDTVEVIGEQLESTDLVPKTQERLSDLEATLETSGSNVLENLMSLLRQLFNIDTPKADKSEEVAGEADSEEAEYVEDEEMVERVEDHDIFDDPGDCCVEPKWVEKLDTGVWYPTIDGRPEHRPYKKWHDIAQSCKIRNLKGLRRSNTIRDRMEKSQAEYAKNHQRALKEWRKEVGKYPMPNPPDIDSRALEDYLHAQGYPGALVSTRVVGPDPETLGIKRVVEISGINDGDSLIEDFKDFGGGIAMSYNSMSSYPMVTMTVDNDLRRMVDSIGGRTYEPASVVRAYRNNRDYRSPASVLGYEPLEGRSLEQRYADNRNRELQREADWMDSMDDWRRNEAKQLAQDLHGMHTIIPRSAYKRVLPGTPEPTPAVNTYDFSHAPRDGEGGYRDLTGKDDSYLRRFIS